MLAEFTFACKDKGCLESTRISNIGGLLALVELEAKSDEGRSPIGVAHDLCSEGNC